MSHSPGHQPPTGSGFFPSVRRIGVARTDDRWVGGVCAGVGHRYGLDPLLVRGLVVVTALFLGVGTLAYGLAWALLPEARDGRIHLEEAIRGRFDIALAGAGALVLIALTQGAWWWDGATRWTALSLAVVAGVVLVVALNHRAPTGHYRPMAPPDHQPGTAAPIGPRGPYDAAGLPASGTSERRETMTPHDEPPPAPPVGAPTTGPPGGAPPPGTTTPMTQPPAPPAAPGPGAQPGSRGITALVVLGLCLLAAAGVLLARQAGLLDVPALLLIGGISLAIIGAALIIGGARGRRQGGLGLLGFFLAIVVVPSALVTATAPGLGQVFGPTGMILGDSDFTPTSTAAATDGYTIGVGELDVDLTRLELSDAADLTVPVGVGVGELVVLVPADWDVAVHAQAGIGDVSGTLRGWQREDAHGASLTGNHRNTTFGSGTDVGVLLHRQRADAPTVRINAHVGVGDITIEEQR